MRVYWILWIYKEFDGGSLVMERFCKEPDDLYHKTSAISDILRTDDGDLRLALLGIRQLILYKIVPE